VRIMPKISNRHEIDLGDNWRIQFDAHNSILVRPVYRVRKNTREGYADTAVVGYYPSSLRGIVAACERAVLLRCGEDEDYSPERVMALAQRYSDALAPLLRLAA